MIEDGELGCVKPAERDGAEGDGPDVVGDLFEPDVLAGEEMADVDPGGMPPDASVGGDLTELEVSRILGGEELRREGPRRGLID